MEQSGGLQRPDSEEASTGEQKSESEGGLGSLPQQETETEPASEPQPVGESQTQEHSQVSSQASVEEQSRRVEHKMLKLSALGTFFAGMAATIGLLFSAWTIHSQTQQQRADSATQDRSQAVRLNAWMSTPIPGTSTDPIIVVVENTSTEPIYNASVTATQYLMGEDPGPKIRRILWGTIPPCSRLALDLTKDDELSSEKIIWQLDGLTVRFSDANGVTWFRDTGISVLRRNAQPDLVRVDVPSKQSAWNEWPGGDLVTTPATNCG
ncbi:hypothetical protein [Streptomyces sp. 058-1L]|uniref:hypothetical protein n=1 Tax=Streptomyces sp. 058-1L TaxID=2789266 RepID=UPI003980FD44